MVPTQTLLGKHYASCAQQDIFVPLLLKGSSLVRMEHTVRMAQLSVQSVQVDTVVLTQVLIHLNVQLVIMLHQGVYTVSPVQWDLTVHHQAFQYMSLVLMALTQTV